MYWVLVDVEARLAATGGTKLVSLRPTVGGSGCRTRMLTERLRRGANAKWRILVQGASSCRESMKIEPVSVTRTNCDGTLLSCDVCSLSASTC